MDRAQAWNAVGMGKGMAWPAGKGMGMVQGWDGQRVEDGHGMWTGSGMELARGYQPCEAAGWALTPWASVPSLPAGEELLEERRLMALGQDFHLQGQGGDRDVVMLPVPARAPLTAAPTCVRGEWPMRAITSSATLRAAWRSCSLALRPIDRNVRATPGMAPVPMCPHPQAPFQT